MKSCAWQTVYDKHDVEKFLHNNLQCLFVNQLAPTKKFCHVESQCDHFNAIVNQKTFQVNRAKNRRDVRKLKKA